MGRCGGGKSNFINNLCKTKHSVGFSLGSLTTDIAYEDVACFPDHAFRIYDTPGTDSE
jgi:predicted GTPase